MTVLDPFIWTVGNGALFALCISLVLRRRVRECYSFAPYVAAMFTSSMLATLWPVRFYTREFWLLSESAHGLLRFAVVIELGARCFSAFPGARVTARRWTLGVLLAGCTITAGPSVDSADYMALGGQVLPRVTAVSLWLFLALAALVLWYRIPIRPFQKALLLGFVPFLLAYSVGLTAWGHSEGRLPIVTLGYRISFILMLLYLTYAAWVPDREAATSPDEAGLLARSPAK